MSTASNNDTRRTEILNVAVSTDTILYTPFFLAYHSSDFEDTPAGKLSVNIIGSEDDARFSHTEKLKGDGFATFCLLFGLADAAICDPSFLVYLQDKGNLATEFEKFEQLLTTYTKSTLSEDPKYKDHVEYKNETLEIKNIEKFKKLFEDKKVIGGLISKIAFSVVGSPDLETIVKNEPYKGKENFGKIHKRNAIGKNFVKNVVTGKFLYYKSPSTGNCIGEIHSAIYDKNPKDSAKPSLIEPLDFGLEISKLNDQGYERSIAITCDFVSLDYQLKKEKNASKSNIVEIENFTEDETKNYMFTGVLGNCEIKNINKLRSLLYGIDKNLFAIYKFLKDSDTTGLTKYFKRKFNYSETKLSELLTLLVADLKCKKEIKDLIVDKNTPLFTFDTIIRFYVDRLYKCKKYGGLYFSSTAPSSIDLKNMSELRYEAEEKEVPTDTAFFDKFVQVDMLADWRTTEAKYFTYEHKVNQLRLKEKASDALILFVSLFMFLKAKWRSSLRNKLWLYVSKPSYLYTVGSIFVIFEIVTGLCHIFGYHLPDMNFQLTIGSTNKDGVFHGIKPIIPIGKIIFAYFNITIIALILLSRNLLKLKENDKYVYRNE